MVSPTAVSSQSGAESPWPAVSRVSSTEVVNATALATNLSPLEQALGSADRTQLSMQAPDFVAYLKSKPILEGSFGEHPLEKLDESRTFTLSDGQQALALRIRTLAPSALAETGALIAVLDELNQLPEVGAVLPKVLGLAVQDGLLYAVVDDFSRNEDWQYVGGARESQWSALKEKHADLAATFEATFSPTVIARMEESNCIDTKGVGFDNLMIDASGALKYQIDFSSPQHFIDSVAHGEVFNISGLGPDSFTLKGRVRAPSLGTAPGASHDFVYPMYIVSDGRDLDLVSYPDDVRRYADIAQGGRSFISYSERPCDPSPSELSRDNLSQPKSVEEALIWAGRRYNSERGVRLSPDESSIGYETAIVFAVLQAKDGTQLLAWCPVRGEHIEVSLTPGYEALKTAFPEYDPILFQSIHTHQLLPYSLPTVQHSVDQRSAVYGLLPKLPEYDKPHDGCAWLQNGAAVLDEVVYIRKEGLVVPPKSGQHATLTGTGTAVGCETLPLFINGTRFPNGPTQVDKQLMIQAVRDLETLKNEPSVVRAVAGNLLEAVTTGNCIVGSCRIAN
ncbi:MAG: hypothetical protein K1X79_07975 [Oligoflexia bacterium]|nr:hypothetical protein [Oligoflexia bacterium]